MSGPYLRHGVACARRVKKSGSTGEQLKEAQAINKSLSALGDVISALASEQPHIPYRNHKLTMLMSDSLGGSAKTLMFVNVSPTDGNLDETQVEGPAARLIWHACACSMLEGGKRASFSQDKHSHAPCRTPMHKHVAGLHMLHYDMKHSWRGGGARGTERTLLEVDSLRMQHASQRMDTELSLPNFALTGAVHACARRTRWRTRRACAPSRTR